MWQILDLFARGLALRREFGLGLFEVQKGGGGELLSGGQLGGLLPVFRRVGGDEAGFNVGAVAVQQRRTHLALHQNNKL